MLQSRAESFALPNKDKNIQNMKTLYRKGTINASTATFQFTLRKREIDKMVLNKHTSYKLTQDFEKRISM